MKNIRPAATILLARDIKGKLEVLLLRRNKALAFAAGAWVFPGGKIETHEMENAKDALEAAKWAAVRETKEEANIDIDKGKLVFFRHWTTPSNEPRRYSTWFFFGPANELHLEVKVDNSEIKEHLWIAPQQALNQFLRGELNMMPPTFISLQLIRNCQSVEEAQLKLQKEEPVFVKPVVQMQGSKLIIMYEGDAGYVSGQAMRLGARHRLIMNPTQRKIRFEYKGCDQVLPVNGGDTFFN